MEPRPAWIVYQACINQKLDNPIATIAKSEEHRRLWREVLSVMSAPLVVNNQTKERQIAWIAFQVRIPCTRSKENVKFVKVVKHHLW
jgi:hypothetical protein